MTDRSPVWIGMVDMALAVLAVALVAVNPPTTVKSGVEMKAEILATVEWDVAVNADVDIHMMGPSRKPVYYFSRVAGCATLDQDNRGFLTSHVPLHDGSTAKVDSNKEVIAIRCIEPGHYDLATNLYAYHTMPGEMIPPSGYGLKAHVEIIGLNPQYHVIYADDVVLNRTGQTVNFASFELARDGKATLTDPPLNPITALYQ